MQRHGRATPEHALLARAAPLPRRWRQSSSSQPAGHSVFSPQNSTSWPRSALESCRRSPSACKRAATSRRAGWLCIVSGRFNRGGVASATFGRRFRHPPHEEEELEGSWRRRTREGQREGEDLHLLLLLRDEGEAGGDGEKDHPQSSSRSRISRMSRRSSSSSRSRRSSRRSSSQDATVPGRAPKLACVAALGSRSPQHARCSGVTRARWGCASGRAGGYTGPQGLWKGFRTESVGSVNSASGV